MRKLNERLTIVMVSHNLYFVSSYVGRVICVNRKVQVHPTSKVDEELVREIYGSDIRIVRHYHQNSKVKD